MKIARNDRAENIENKLKFMLVGKMKIWGDSVLGKLIGCVETTMGKFSKLKSKRWLKVIRNCRGQKDGSWNGFSLVEMIRGFIRSRLNDRKDLLGMFASSRGEGKRQNSLYYIFDYICQPQHWNVEKDSARKRQKKKLINEKRPETIFHPSATLGASLMRLPFFLL